MALSLSREGGRVRRRCLPRRRRRRYRRRVEGSWRENEPAMTFCLNCVFEFGEEKVI